MGISPPTLKGTAIAIETLSAKRPFTGRSPFGPETTLDNGEPDRMIVGRQNGRVRENCDGPDRLCAGFDAIHVRSEYAKTSYAALVAYLTKIGELNTKLAKEAFKRRSHVA